MQSDLEKVKQLLLGKDYDELLELKAKLGNDTDFAKAVSHVVAEALEIRADADEKVSEVLAPTIDQAISGSINQDPKKLAESLYPIMGPAIRKSISETLQQMLENFNQLLEQSFSPQSLRWRFDAWRTGRSYSELVLLNTLEYQVEQIFLIHKETSLLIHHEHSDFADMKDPDMVSSMFSAIQDFIEDSFKVDEHNKLDTLRLGDMTVVLQEGPQAVLAALVRGSVPEHLRFKMKDTIEGLHLRKRNQLVDYSGDQLDFADESDDLRALLVMQQKEIEEERSIPWLAIGVILIVTIFSTYFGYLEREANNARLSRLASFDATPGIVLLSHTRVDDALQIVALVDPSVDAEAVISDLKFSGETRLKSQAYLSADAEVLLKKSIDVLSPETSTKLFIDGATLTLAGNATAQWVRNQLPAWASIPGLESVDTSNLEVNNPLVEEMEALQSALAEFNYEFEKEDTSILADEKHVRTIVDAMHRIIQLRQAENLPAVVFDVVGYTDDTGSERLNRRIGLRRAEGLIQQLVEQGAPADLLEPYLGMEYELAPDQSKREVRIYVRPGNT